MNRLYVPGDRYSDVAAVDSLYNLIALELLDWQLGILRDDSVTQLYRSKGSTGRYKF
jgi:hypothetical protein